MQDYFSRILDFIRVSSGKPEDFFSVGRQLLPSPRNFFHVGDLSKILANPLLSPDWLKIIRKGEDIGLSSSYLWKTVQGKKLQFMDKTELNQLLMNGASLVLEGLDILDRSIGSLCKEIDQQFPCALVNCEAFFSRHGNEAYGGHRDTDDVLVIQLEGTKRWSIFEPQQRSYFENAPLNKSQLGKLAQTIDLSPGDCLFVRAGVPHLVETLTNRSMHLSFDLIDRTVNIDQISNAANGVFNRSLCPPHSPAHELIAKYVNLLGTEKFRHEISAAQDHLSSEVRKFRNRIISATDEINPEAL